MRLRRIFAENLRRWRVERGLSQEVLADNAGIDRTYVSALERSVYSVSLDTVEKLAQALDIEPHQFLTTKSD
ncbi:MAG TPA: helix-turn-helix transcriptional regulator [Sphingomonadaceae bacterium]|nr:helix-turn-helix transcriptional regulator [Sphingomonadaceae bacterium]